MRPLPQEAEHEDDDGNKPNTYDDTEGGEYPKREN